MDMYLFRVIVAEAAANILANAVHVITLNVRFDYTLINFNKKVRYRRQTELQRGQTLAKIGL